MKISDIEQLREQYGNVTLDEILNILEEKIKTKPLEEKYTKEIGKFYKTLSNDIDVKEYFHITNVSGIDGMITVLFDTLSIERYSHIDYTTDIEWCWEDFFENNFHSIIEITEEKWNNEVCYYLKRIPGRNDKCCS